VIRLAAVQLEIPDHPLLGTIFLIYRTNNAETLASSFDTARGLFQLRACGACVIVSAARKV
jgi:hypothetical protein